MEDVLQQGFRPLPLHPDGAATHRLKSGLRCCLRGLQHSAAQKPTNRASQLKREARAEPNGNRDDRFGPIWQMVHGVVPRHTDKSPSCSRLGYWIVDYGGRPASTAEVGSSRVGRGSAFISAELKRAALPHLGLGATPSACHSLRNRDQPITQAVSNTNKGQSKTPTAMTDHSPKLKSCLSRDVHVAR
jgi:hypothetical protein